MSLLSFPPLGAKTKSVSGFVSRRRQKGKRTKGVNVSKTLQRKLIVEIVQLLTSANVKMPFKNEIKEHFLHAGKSFLLPLAECFVTM